ncbi:MAG TPA: glucose 1-dehydrogenase [Candidatus Cybelea sp.]|nr:glucose 1-dehydrogenase [Candidatus Cybelea sp.]
MDRLKGKVALITGAASGIGRATAALFAREGAKVVLTDLDGKAGEAVAADIAKSGGETLFLKHDATNEADWQRVVAAAISAFGRLDALVNNAGIGLAKSLLETTVDDWRRVMAVNLEGVFLGTREGVLVMRDRGGGAIVNVSSIAGIVGLPRSPAYSASKGGVRLLTKAAALESAQSGWKVRINSVHPGYIETPMVLGHIARAADPEQARQYLISRHPIGRLGRPEEIAEAILFLASDESSFMTGAELVADGGYTAQ